MVRIRLRRVGAKKQPSFRIVAADKESPRDGRFLEILGHYNPRTEPATVVVKEDRLYHWIGNGAQPSESVVQVLRAAGILERVERFKKGEDVDALLAEAAADQQHQNVKTQQSGLSEKEQVAEEPAEEPQAVTEEAQE